jgi:hypothetical protein
LDGIASLCAYEYGDAVHWARSLIFEYSSTDYYTNNNGKIITSSKSRDKTDSNTSMEYAFIYPNPVSFPVFRHILKSIITKNLAAEKLIAFCSSQRMRK